MFDTGHGKDVIDLFCRTGPGDHSKRARESNRLKDPTSTPPFVKFGVSSLRPIVYVAFTNTPPNQSPTTPYKRLQLQIHQRNVSLPPIIFLCCLNARWPFLQRQPPQLVFSDMLFFDPCTKSTNPELFVCPQIGQISDSRSEKVWHFELRIPVLVHALTTPSSSVNGHVESKYSVHTGQWSEPTFVEDPFLRLHGLAPGLNYGMQPVISSTPLASTPNT